MQLVRRLRTLSPSRSDWQSVGTDKKETGWGCRFSDISLPAEAAPVDDAIPAEVVGLLVKGDIARSITGVVLWNEHADTTTVGLRVKLVEVLIVKVYASGQPLKGHTPIGISQVEGLFPSCIIGGAGIALDIGVICESALSTKMSMRLFAGMLTAPSVIFLISPEILLVSEFSAAI